MAIYRSRTEAVQLNVAGTDLAPQPATTITAEASSEAATIHAAEAWLGVGVFLVCLVVARFLIDSSVTFSPVDGITVFAVFYVIALAIERLLEFLDTPIEWVLKKFGSRDSKTELEHARDQAVALALSDPAQAQGAADGQADVNKAAKSRTAALAGVAGGIGILAADYLNADFLSAIGVTDMDQVIALAVTGLVVAGGSKQLHDLITNVSKASEEKSTPVETSPTS